MTTRSSCPFVFAEVKLPAGPSGATAATRRRKLPDSRGHSSGTPAGEAGLRLALPHDAAHEVRFRVVWDAGTARPGSSRMP